MNMINRENVIEQKDQYLYMAIFNYDLLYTLKVNNILGDEKYISKSPVLRDRACLEAIKKVGVDNQMALMSSLYSLFVVPKQGVFTQSFTDEFNAFLKSKAEIIGENTYHDDNLTRHLRNALAHSRVEFLSDSLIEFKDQNDSQSITFQIATQDVSEFLNLVIRKVTIYLNNKYPGN